MSNFPRNLLQLEDNFKTVMSTLIQASHCLSGPIVAGQPSTINTQMSKGLDNWVQARKDSIKALSNLLAKIKLNEDLELFKVNDSNLTECFECFLHGLNDYSIDSKGDSGSKVREASIEGLEALIITCAKLNLVNIINDQNILSRIFSGIVQQSVERIDRTRNLAGKAFYNLIYNKHLKLENIDFIGRVRSVFKKHACYLMDWHVAQVTLPLFIQLIYIKEFQTSLITGFVFSIGSLTESLVKSATSTFLKELSSMKFNQTFRQVLDTILQLCRTSLRNDRLSSSLIKTVDLMVQNNLLSDDSVREYPAQFLSAFLDNVKVTRDMQKLISYVDLFCDFLQFEAERVREKAMVQLAIMLCHQYPRIRKAAASKLFEALINYSEIFENEADNDECINLLSETDWDQSVEIIRPIRNRICDLTKTPKPVLKKN